MLSVQSKSRVGRPWCCPIASHSRSEPGSYWKYGRTRRLNSMRHKRSSVKLIRQRASVGRVFPGSGSADFWLKLMFAIHDAAKNPILGMDFGKLGKGHPVANY